jgi:ABC-type ATPase with predicted acetyltransferase domain
MLKERSIAFERIKPKGGKVDDFISNTARFKAINTHMIALSRVVLDTMYRGVGAAYRFKNLVSRMSGYRFCESQSAMAKYNKFTERSGFISIKPQRSLKYEMGLKFMRSTFEANPADTSGLLAELESMRPAAREATIKATREFYYRCSALEKTGGARGRPSRVDTMPVPELIKQLQQVILASPVYSIYPNPDFGRVLPDRLPLTAFDRQAPDQPLVLP